MNSKITTTEMVLKGYLWVNIPCTAIILIFWLGLWFGLNLNYIFSIFIGTLCGWYYWAFAIKKWIKWAFENDIKKEKIVKVGRLSLLLWNKSTVENALTDEKH